MTDAAGRVQSVTEALAYLAGWECTSGRDMHRVLTGLPEMLLGLELGLSAIAGQLKGGPFDPRVAGLADDMIPPAAGLADRAWELLDDFQHAHADDLERLEDPRNRMWDVGPGQGSRAPSPAGPDAEIIDIQPWLRRHDPPETPA